MKSTLIKSHPTGDISRRVLLFLPLIVGYFSAPSGAFFEDLRETSLTS